MPDARKREKVKRKRIKSRLESPAFFTLYGKEE